jgi:hypothetical protein
MSLRLHVMVTKNSDFCVPNDCSYDQLANIQNFYLSLRLWSNRERHLTFQLLNSRESKFRDICGDKCLGIIISLFFFGLDCSNLYSLNLFYIVIFISDLIVSEISICTFISVAELITFVIFLLNSISSINDNHYCLSNEWCKFKVP